MAGREAELRTTLQTETGKSPQEIVKEMPPYYVMIDEMDDFYGMQTTNKKEISELLQRATAVGITLIVTATVGRLQGPDELTRWLKQTKDGLLVSPQGYQNIFPIPFGKDKVDMGEGLLFETGLAKRLQLAKE